MNRARPSLLALLLATLILAVFWSARHHEFVWDDRGNIEENVYLNPPTGPSLLHFWQQPYRSLYIPLTYTAWAGIARFAARPAADGGRAGLDPAPFHIANLTFHALAALGVFALLRLLARNDWTAFGGASLFALHPVQVEPVVWVTGMKDVLAGFLSIMAIWQYLAYAREPSAPGHRRRYVLATVAFLLAMLAKPSAVVVPLIAGILDYSALKRPWRKVAGGLTAWVLLALPFVVVTRWVQPAVELAFIPPWWTRPLIAADAVGFYFYTLAFPLWLGVDYGRTPEWVLREGWAQFAWLVPLG